MSKNLDIKQMLTKMEDLEGQIIAAAMLQVPK
jgi:hypothetical protein